jgi:hypothetical protein
MRTYARLLGWTEVSPARILGGEEPEPATPPASQETAAGGPDLPSAIDRELRSGRTLDHTVVHLGEEDDDDTRIIVVLKGSDDISDTELDELWLKWRRARRQLQAIPGETDTASDS